MSGLLKVTCHICGRFDLPCCEHIANGFRLAGAEQERTVADLSRLRAAVEALRTAASTHGRWQFDRMFGAVEGRDVYDSAEFVRALKALLLPGGDDAKEMNRG